MWKHLLFPEDVKVFHASVPLAVPALPFPTVSVWTLTCFLVPLPPDHCLLYAASGLCIYFYFVYITVHHYHLFICLSPLLLDSELIDRRIFVLYCCFLGPRTLSGTQ